MPESRRSGIVRTGVHTELETVADEILRQSLRGVTRHSDKSDILTPWKEQARKSREVYVASGVPDRANRRGDINRAWNPMHAHLNSTEGMAPRRPTDNAPSSDPKEMDRSDRFGDSVWDSE